MFFFSFSPHREFSPLRLVSVLSLEIVAVSFICIMEFRGEVVRQIARGVSAVLCCFEVCSGFFGAAQSELRGGGWFRMFFFGCFKVWCGS